MFRYILSFSINRKPKKYNLQGSSNFNEKIKYFEQYFLGQRVEQTVQVNFDCGYMEAGAWKIR